MLLRAERDTSSKTMSVSAQLVTRIMTRNHPFVNLKQSYFDWCGVKLVMDRDNTSTSAQWFVSRSNITSLFNASGNGMDDVAVVVPKLPLIPLH